MQPIIGTQMTLGDTAGSGEVVLLAMNEVVYKFMSIAVPALLKQMLPKGLSKHGYVRSLCGRAPGTVRRRHGRFCGAPVADGRLALAKKRLESLMRLCSGRVYIQLQRHGLPEEDRAEAGLLELAVELPPLVATNDCRFDAPEMHQAHMHSSVLVTDAKCLRMTGSAIRNNYFRTAAGGAAVCRYS